MSEQFPETPAEQTAQINDLIIAVRHAEAKADAAATAARSAKRAPARARKPLAWSAALVLIVAALSGLGAWIAYLGLGS